MTTSDNGEAALNRYTVTVQVDSPAGPGETMERFTQILRTAENGLAFGSSRLSSRDRDGAVPPPNMTPHMALRILEREFAAGDASKYATPMQQAAFDKLWEHVLRGE